jgi:hypothetical protein
MSLGGTLATALLVTLARPSSWVLALAGFLARGGIVVVLLPIVIVPSPVGLADIVAPTLLEFVFGGVSVGFIALIAVALAAILAWLIGGGLIAAAAEVELALMVATDDESAGGPDVSRPGVETVDSAPRRHPVLGALAIRLAGQLPLFAVVAWGLPRIVAATYRELTIPGAVTVPIVWRVIGAVPEVVGALVLAWLLGEIVGGIAVRRLALDGHGVADSLGRAIVRIVRSPRRTLTLAVLPAVVLALVLVPAAAASGAAWHAVDVTMRDGAPPLTRGFALIALSGLWLGGLALTGVVCAWRQAVWTVERLAARDGTFGAVPPVHPGEWNPDASSATL